MTQPVFLQSLARVLNCPKVHVATTGLVTTWFAVRYAADGLPPTQRASLWVAFVAAVAIELREIINAWTAEDLAGAKGQKRGARGPEPEVVPTSEKKVGGAWVGGERVRTHSPPTHARPPPRPTQSSVLSPQSSSPNPPPRRSPSMPPRTKLPLLLLVLIPAGFLAACQSCPELSVYREGLHQVDEPLYQAHSLLMDDAVKAGLRTDADRQVIQQGIAAARALYQQSRAAETQPGQ